METINIVQGGQPQPPAVLIFGNSHHHFFPSVWHVPRVPIIAFTHYEIRDFPPNCAELIRGLPAASPSSLLLAFGSARGEGVRIRLVAGKTDRSKYRKIFLQCWRAGSSLAGARLRITAT